MDWLDKKSPVPGGGTAASGGRFYHLSFRSGSRASGACARASHDYIAREGEYANGDRDPAIHTESDHMPLWAVGSPGDYWDAADLYERANGRLHVSADFALPRELSSEDQIALAHEFAQELTKNGSLPYTLAVHAGRDRDGLEHNPHAHLMISERKNDGIDRSPKQWFSRANPTDRSKGGAEKTRAIHGHAWMEHARKQWADLTNKTLERLGRDGRVDHRSYTRQGVDQDPGRHFGPAAAHMISRGQHHDRLDSAANALTDSERLQAIDRAIGDLEFERQAVLAGEQKRVERESAPGGGTSGGGPTRDQDESRSR
jgi:MobA/MobL family protein